MAVVFRFRNQLTRYMTATGAANNAKRRANNISSFFMADLPSLAMSRLPDQGRTPVTAITFWSFVVTPRRQSHKTFHTCCQSWPLLFVGRRIICCCDLIQAIERL